MRPILTYFPDVFPKRKYSNNDLSPYVVHTEKLFINIQILLLDLLILNRIAIMMYKYTNAMLLQLCTNYARKTMNFIPMTLAIRFI